MAWPSLIAVWEQIRIRPMLTPWVLSPLVCGGLEAENVMLGRPSMMRLPDIIGVKLTGRCPAGITATDIVLAMTEFLREQRVVYA